MRLVAPAVMLTALMLPALMLSALLAGAQAAAQTFSPYTIPATAPPAASTPDTIPLQRTNPDGTRFALLEGVRTVPGAPFTHAFLIPAGVWDSPHSHAATARVVVARGSLHLGYGRAMDKGAAPAFPVGSVLVVPAGAVHFDGSDEDTIIIGTAIGPWSTDYVDAAAAASAGAPSK